MTEGNEIPSRTRQQDKDLLMTVLRGVGLEVDEFSRDRNPELFAEDPLLAGLASQGPLATYPSAIVSAVDDVCKFTMRLGPFGEKTGVAGVNRLARAAVELLRLSRELPFGRVTFAPFPPGSGPLDGVELAFVETMFFWRYGEKVPDMLADEVEERLTGLGILWAKAKIVLTEAQKE